MNENKTENVLFRIFRSFMISKVRRHFHEKKFEFHQKHHPTFPNDLCWGSETQRCAAPSQACNEFPESRRNWLASGELKFCLSGKRAQSSDDLTNVTSGQKWTHES